jgi:hypothetical protein
VAHRAKHHRHASRDCWLTEPWLQAIKKKPCPLMGWSGRTPAPAAISWPGAPRQGARHVIETRYFAAAIGIDIGKNSFRPTPARRHRAAAEVVALPGGGPTRQSAAVSDWHGGVRRVAGYPGNTVRYALTSHATGYRGAGFGLTLRR